MKLKLIFCVILPTSLLLAGCQSIPPVEEGNIDNDVCIGEPVAVDPDQAIDLEEMARQAECP